MLTGKIVRRRAYGFIASLTVVASASAGLAAEPPAERREVIEAVAVALSEDDCAAAVSASLPELAELTEQTEASLRDGQMNEAAVQIRMAASTLDLIRASAEAAAQTGATRLYAADVAEIAGIAELAGSEVARIVAGAEEALDALETANATAEALAAMQSDAADMAHLAASLLARIQNEDAPSEERASDEILRLTELYVELERSTQQGSLLGSAERDLELELVESQMNSYRQAVEERAALEIYKRIVDACISSREMTILLGEDIAEPAADILMCREDTGDMRSALFADLWVSVPGMSCAYEPCLDANVTGTFFTNGCFWARVQNIGDYDAVGDDFHLYGLVGPEGGVEARLVVGTGAGSRFQDKPAPLELLVAGAVRESPSVPAPVGGGEIFAPSSLPAEWSAFAGATGEWKMRE